jgi:hypothetical protein
MELLNRLYTWLSGVKRKPDRWSGKPASRPGGTPDPRSDDRPGTDRCETDAVTVEAERARIMESRANLRLLRKALREARRQRMR